jgi:hypothetical protein
MTIHPVRMAGAVCAALTALLLVSISAPANAQSRDTRMTLAPAAQSAANAKSMRVVTTTRGVTTTRVAATTKRERRPNRMPHWNTYTTGTPDLAFLSAEQHFELAAYEGAVWVVAENEFSLLDFAAGTVRIVEQDELSEIDLANDPEKMLAEVRSIEQPQTTFQVASAAPEPAKPEEDDGILNRILMTFAGALALAGAMKLLIA